MTLLNGLTDTTRTSTEPLGRSAAPSPRNSPEMNRLREMIVGDAQNRIEDISRLVTSRDARVRRLVEDIPEALQKNTVDQSSLTRLATALRAPIEEALEQSVQTNHQKLADILAPALASALPRTLTTFLLSLPASLLNRAWHVIWPWAGSAHGKTSAGQFSAQAHSVQVDRVCVFQKDTLAVLRSSDMGFDDPTTALEVDHLFAQLADALRAGTGSPTAQLSYPRPRSKKETQNMLVLTGEHTILAAYYIGQPPIWFRDRMQIIADEVDAVSHALLTTDRPKEAQIEQLDGHLKKALICYVPPTNTQTQPISGRAAIWLKDAAVIAAVIGIVWIVAGISRSSTQWTQTIRTLDAEPGIVVLDHSWLPGGSISGLIDPLAPTPQSTLESLGYKSEGVDLSFTHFVSDDAPYREQRAALQRAEREAVKREISGSYARALALMEASLETQSNPAATNGDGRSALRKELLRSILDLPMDANFDFRDGVLTIPAALPKNTHDRIKETLKLVPWIKQTIEADIPVKTTTSLIPGLIHSQSARTTGIAKTNTVEPLTH